MYCSVLDTVNGDCSIGHASLDLRVLFCRSSGVCAPEWKAICNLAQILDLQVVREITNGVDCSEPVF